MLSILHLLFSLNYSIFKTACSILVFLATISQHVTTQKGQPAFGKVDRADLLMTDCGFDKGTDALTLIDWGNTYYNRETDGYSLFKNIVFNRFQQVENNLLYMRITIKLKKSFYPLNAYPAVREFYKKMMDK